METKRPKEAGGEDDPVDEGGLGSTPVWTWSLVCGWLGRAEAGGQGRRGDSGGETGAPCLGGEATGPKSGLAEEVVAW